MAYIQDLLDGLAYSGDLELNIVIRTAFIQDGMAHIQAGAGIVIDSIPSAGVCGVVKQSKSNMASESNGGRRKKSMILMIDNYDSFTYNLVQYIGELGVEVKVVNEMMHLP